MKSCRLQLNLLTIHYISNNWQNGPTVTLRTLLYFWIFSHICLSHPQFLQSSVKQARATWSTNLYRVVLPAVRSAKIILTLGRMVWWKQRKICDGVSEFDDGDERNKYWVSSNIHYKLLGEFIRLSASVYIINEAHFPKLLFAQKHIFKNMHGTNIFQSNTFAINYMIYRIDI